ncbi:hypothetical protein Tco_0670637 [Tanacetum coccineum]
MLLRCHRYLRCRYPWRATIRRLRDDGDNESHGGQIITFAAMARQMIAFAAMAGQMITFAAMAGQIITFASIQGILASKTLWFAYTSSMPPILLLPLSVACDDSDVCVTIAMAKGEIYVECDSVVVCELLLGLRPWHLKSDYWYTIVCDCVGWRRCDEAGLAMMSLLVGRNRDKAICILAWQLTKVAAMAYIAIAHAKRLIESGARASDIGTIILILHRTKEDKLKDLEIPLADGFQGREKETTIKEMIRLDGIHLRPCLAEVQLEIFVQRREKMNTRSTDERRAGQTPYQLLAIK